MQKHFKAEMDITDERHFSRFELNMSFLGLFEIAAALSPVNIRRR